jgi:lysyl endopeptidase
MSKHPLTMTATCVVVLLLASGVQGADGLERPRPVIQDVLSASRPASEIFAVKPLRGVARIETPLPDLTDVHAEDADDARRGLPPRFALPQPVWITPDTDGTWEEPREGLMLWRLRIGSPGALSLNLGFSQFALPKGARLLIHSARGSERVRPFTHRDNAAHKQLWTPIMTTDEIVVELSIAKESMTDLELVLSSINAGYRLFGDRSAARSGSCNVDVVCPEGDGWRNEIPASGVYTVSGIWTCSGSLVNNTAQDQTPYFLTADHCGVSSGNASSVVIYWNYENSTCRPPGSGASGSAGDGSLAEFSSGTTFRAGYSPSDMTLLEVNGALDPAWQLSLAGWDATGADAPSAVAIHHPSTDEKRISFEDDPTTTTTYLQESVPGDGTHVRVIDWDLGTTEPGSSGSPLFNPDHRIIGQLHGGFASCTSQTSDWYGKLSVSWTGGGSSSTRLSDWLDPTSSGALVLDTLSGAGMSVAPGGDVLHLGQAGGPFTNPAIVYTLTNPTNQAISYSVSLTSSFGLLLDGAKDPLTGTLSALGGSTTVTVSLGPDIAVLPAGIYAEQVVFEDLTNTKTTTITHTVEVDQTLISVTPSEDFETGGPIGGPFTGSTTYTVTSQRPTATAVTVTADQPWITLNGGTGPLNLNLTGVGDFDDVAIGIDPSAGALAAGSYSGTVTFTNQTGGGGSTTRDVTLDVGALLYVSKDTPIAINDNSTINSTIVIPAGFCIAEVEVDVDISHTYIGDLEVDLIAPSGTAVRLHDRSGGSSSDIVTTYAEPGGTIPDGPGSLSDLIDEQTAGTWTLRVRDNANQDTGTLNSWALRIKVSGSTCPVRAVLHDFPMDTDPGWSVSGQWAFGQPTGGAGSSGASDPAAGFTGSNVYGYNLNGGYANNLSSVQYLTTPPLDCSDATGTRLVFQRWLGVESATYDHANIEVSNDGVNWQPVWEHAGSALDDGAWRTLTYDISAVADGASAVRIRWGMGTTDSSVTYCGWNIDDVQIQGFLPPPPTWDDCMTGPNAGPHAPGCAPFDHDGDLDVDLYDFALAQ